MSNLNTFWTRWCIVIKYELYSESGINVIRFINFIFESLRTHVNWAHFDKYSLSISSIKRSVSAYVSKAVVLCVMIIELNNLLPAFFFLIHPDLLCFRKNNVGPRRTRLVSLKGLWHSCKRYFCHKNSFLYSMDLYEPHFALEIHKYQWKYMSKDV